MKRLLSAVLVVSFSASAWGQDVEGRDYEIRMLAEYERKGYKLYDQVDKFSGFINCLKEELGKILFVGELVEDIEFDKIRSARLEYELFRPLLPPVMDFAILGRRYEKTEYIDSEIYYSSFTFTFPEMIPDVSCLSPLSSYRAKLTGISDYLAWEGAYILGRLAEEVSVYNDAIDRRELRERLKAVRILRNIIGVPPLVTTEEELWEAVRERGLEPDDRVRVKSGQDASTKIITVQEFIDAISGRTPEEDAH